MKENFSTKEIYEEKIYMEKNENYNHYHTEGKCDKKKRDA